MYCRSLIPILKELPIKKKRLGKIKISQLLFDLQFDELVLRWAKMMLFVNAFSH